MIDRAVDVADGPASGAGEAGAHQAGDGCRHHAGEGAPVQEIRECGDGEIKHQRPAKQTQCRRARELEEQEQQSYEDDHSGFDDHGRRPPRRERDR